MPKKTKPRTARIRVVERKLGREQAWGLAWGDGVVEVDPRQKAREYLDTLCHEVLHELLPRRACDCDWWEDEDRLEGFMELAGTTLAGVLWRRGYRLVNLK